jgi:hypothetical protein
MKYSKIGLSVLALALASTIFTGCKKTFLDVNDNPNQPTDDNITPELIFVQAAHATGARQASGNWSFLNKWMGYFASSGDFALQQDETSYNIDFNFGEAIWQNHFNVLFDLHQVHDKALAKGDSVLAGASMVLSAKLFQELVDVYGNIPYTQIFKYNETRTPAYDKAIDIYADLQKKLDTAIIFLSKTPRSNFNSYIGAVVRIGNETLGTASPVTAPSVKIAHWIKFANTLKLRLLIRQSNVPSVNPAPEIAKIIANGGVLHAGESVNVNPGYVDDVNKQSPYYAVYGFTPTGADANTSTRANQYIVGILNSSNDKRLQRFFRNPSAGGNVTGNIYGLASGNPPGANTSKMGVGIAGSATQDQWIMPSFESMFLEAEAIARGWMPGNAQTAYENAVRESFVWLGVPNAITEANNYLATAPIAQWANAGATVTSKVKFIAYQKYIALTGIDPLEAWSDLRRLNMIPNTGYISVNPSRIANQLPVRLLYPQSEYTTNSANVNGEGSIDLFTSKIFWQP